MNRFLPLLCVLLFAAVSCSTSQSRVLSEAELRSRVARIHIGMSHPEVRSLLPVYSRPITAAVADGVELLGDGEVTTITGSGQVEAYHVSPEWMVYVPYDHSKPEPRIKGVVTIARTTK